MNQEQGRSAILNIDRRNHAHSQEHVRRATHTFKKPSMWHATMRGVGCRQQVPRCVWGNRHDQCGIIIRGSNAV